MLLIDVLDASGRELHLAARADQGDCYLFAITLDQLRSSLIYTQSHNIVGRIEASTVFREVQDLPARPLGQIFDDQGTNAEISYLQAGGAAGVGFLDPTGQRRFAANRDAVEGRNPMPDQQPRGKDQLVAWAERLTGGWDFIEQNTRGEPTAAQTVP